MSRLALTRLVTAGNRSSRFRLAGVAAGVMVGVALFLLLFSASQAFGERSLRSTWSELISTHPTYLTSADIQLAPNEVAAVSTLDHYRDQVIRVVKIAIPENSAIGIPGVSRTPQLGQYVASPALTALIGSVPADELQNRYGSPIGQIGTDALEGPDSLVVVVGSSLGEVAATDSLSGAQIVSEFTGYDYSSQSYRVIAIIGAVAVLIPVLLLIAIVTDLGAAQRAERFATLRLIGATPQQVARIAAIETTIVTLVGVILGVGLYLAVIPLAARLEIGTSRFYPSDLLTTPLTMAIVAALTVFSSTAVAWWRTRRAGIGPLGAARERHEHQPRPTVLLPVVVGIAALGAGAWLRGSGTGIEMTGVVLIAGFVLAMIGLLLSGPLLTAWAAQVGAARARTAAQVIGYNRIVRHPRASFRAVAGLVIAVYTVTVFAVAVTAAAGVAEIKTGTNMLPTTTLYSFVTTPDGDEFSDAAIAISDVSGVTAVVVAPLQNDGRLILTSRAAAALGAPDTDSTTGYVSIGQDWLIDAPAHPEPATGTDGADAGQSVVLVSTDGTPAAVERARTALTASGLNLTIPPVTRADNAATTSLAMENQFAALAYTGILIAAGLSTISLTVSTLAALISRQRVFGLLKLVGMPQQTLRSVISYEMVLPVATVFLTSIALGVFTAWAVIAGLTGRTLSWPDASYYVILAGCAVLVVLAIAAATRSARRLLRGTIMRFE